MSDIAEKGYLARKVNFFFGHPLRDVYLCFFSQVFFGFFVTTTLAATVDVGLFADYSIALVSTGCAAVIVSSVFDGILNRDISEGGYGSYFGVLAVKALMYFVFALIYFSLVDLPAYISAFSLLVSFFGVLIEHQDLYIRFNQFYSAFRVRFFLACVLFPVKLFFALQGELGGVIFTAAIEVLVLCLLNLRVVRLSVIECGFGFSLIKPSEVIKAAFSGGAVFLFLRVDQFFVYFFVGRESFAAYSLAVRFNELANGLAGVVGRHYIPRLYSGGVSFRGALLAVWRANAVFSLLVYFGAILYFSMIVPGFKESAVILPCLLVSGFFLSFGQLRGVAFMKNRRFYPDIINALVGLGFFVVCVGGFQVGKGTSVALLWSLACLVSGVLMTVLYSDGRKFLANILG